MNKEINQEIKLSEEAISELTLLNKVTSNPSLAKYSQLSQETIQEIALESESESEGEEVKDNIIVKIYKAIIAGIKKVWNFVVSIFRKIATWLGLVENSAEDLKDLTNNPEEIVHQAVQSAADEIAKPETPFNEAKERAVSVTEKVEADTTGVKQSKTVEELLKEFKAALAEKGIDITINLVNKDSNEKEEKTNTVEKKEKSKRDSMNEYKVKAEQAKISTKLDYQLRSANDEKMFNFMPGVQPFDTKFLSLMEERCKTILKMFETTERILKQYNNDVYTLTLDVIKNIFDAAYHHSTNAKNGNGQPGSTTYDNYKYNNVTGFTLKTDGPEDGRFFNIRTRKLHHDVDSQLRVFLKQYIPQRFHNVYKDAYKELIQGKGNVQISPTEMLYINTTSTSFNNNNRNVNSVDFTEDVDIDIKPNKSNVNTNVTVTGRQLIDYMGKLSEVTIRLNKDAYSKLKKISHDASNNNIDDRRLHKLVQDFVKYIIQKFGRNAASWENSLAKNKHMINFVKDAFTAVNRIMVKQFIKANKLLSITLNVLSKQNTILKDVRGKLIPR